MLSIRSSVIGAALGLALLLAAGPSPALAEEGLQPLPVAELDAAVADVAAKLCPDAKIAAAKKEMDRNDQGELREIDYEIEMTTKGGKVHTLEIDTTPEGKPKLDECNARGPVAEADLPAAIAEAARKLCPDGKITEGERRARFSKDKVEAEYEIKLTLADNKPAELRVALDTDGAVRSTRLTAPTAVADVPKPIADVLNIICPGATIAEADKQTEARGDSIRVQFELKLKTADGKAMRADVRLADDGRIRSLEVRED